MWTHSKKDPGLHKILFLMFCFSTTYVYLWFVLFDWMIIKDAKVEDKTQIVLFFMGHC